MSQVSSANATNFQSEVLRSNLPVVVDFYASWCGPCRTLAPILDQVAQDYKGRVKIVKVNIDEEPELAEHYQVSGVPAMYFFRNGGLVDGIVGLPSPQVLLAKLNAISPAKSECATQSASRSCGCGKR